MPDFYIIKSNGERESFHHEKLQTSLVKAGASEVLAAEIVRDMAPFVKDGMTTGQIYKHAFELLHKKSKPIAIKYSLKRAILEFGPDGFPFEKFVAEIFRAQGYEALTDQVVQGHCVEHEVDVVAWKGDELVMVEAKYHNEESYKSDLKVALYVKARFDDLSTEKFEFGGKSRSLTRGVLVTSTKFTDHAIRYGECQGLSMIGWNYPAKGNLHDLVSDLKIHPLTGLGTLSVTDKKALLKAGLILCKDLVREKDSLVGLGIDSAKLPEIFAEIETVCESHK